MPHASAEPSKTLLTPKNHILMMIDLQPQMTFATRSIDIGILRNNSALLAHMSKEFHVPTIVTAIATESFSGPTLSEITDVFPEKEIIERTTMNCWEDKNVVAKVNQLKKPKLVLSGLWTSVCIADPALSAIEQGFEVYVVSDACGDVTPEAHSQALERMIQVGIRPLTSVTYGLELQRDWARTETYDQVIQVLKQYGSGYGVGISYAQAMFKAPEGEAEAA